MMIDLLKSQVNMFSLIINLLVLFCVFALLVSILVDFVEFQSKKNVKKEKKSLVETGTMLLFFLGFYSLLRLRIGYLDFDYSIIKIILVFLGSIILLLGCLTNIRGRIFLGHNWANQIKIYHDHSLIKNGPYRFIRHPLYASIIWMFLGASLIYFNYLALLATLCIFIPFMYWRGTQEEKLLSQEFSEYKNYQSKVGMFFPKL